MKIKRGNGNIYNASNKSILEKKRKKKNRIELIQQIHLSFIESEKDFVS